MHNLPVSTPYITKAHTETKRSKALALETTYAYDFPALFKNNLIEMWREHRLRNPDCVCPADSEVCSYVELVLDSEEKKVVEGHCYPGHNTIGMVAWKLKVEKIQTVIFASKIGLLFSQLKTLEYPKNGREIVVIANDISHSIGSFGPKEDLMFYRASEYARARKIPRIYIAANSGARIGIANEVLRLVKVAWENPMDPEKGFKYLYLSPDEYRDLNTQNHPTKSGESAVVKAKLVEEDGDRRYKITSIIGQGSDIGVENLSAAGLIAGETSQSYEEIVTMSLATSRAIGIGAYLVRLGQRVVQVDNSAIILTGATALNKLLGREVYTSNTQLGGPQIMYNNGVSHATTRNDVEGVKVLLKWLSFVPKKKGSSLPILEASHDPVDRPVEYCPNANEVYDPRWLLAGREDPKGGYQSGFFDHGSFDEIMAAWARTVVTGRARLGGIPVGVIAVETRPIELHLPADPANPDSEAKVVSQAGQVWFPDSAYKTAQAIFDFNREELPLIVFANWRGFSGGMKDMYEQVIKFGAQIVDALHTYNQPIIIYIPPHAELRGGSWVVIDPTINSEQMEMYADPTSRGGVLEAEGTVSIKLRLKDQKPVMERLDPKMRELNAALNNDDEGNNLSMAKKAELEAAIKKRVEVLSPIYHQVAVQFADLHDTPERMKAKEVIRDIVPWAESRRRLYHRLRRRLLESKMMKKIDKTKSNLSHGQKHQLIRRWFMDHEIKKPSNVEKFSWESDKAVAEWMSEQLASSSSKKSTEGTGSLVGENLKVMEREAAMAAFREVVGTMPDDLLLEAGVLLAEKMTSGKREEFIEALKLLPNKDDTLGAAAEGSGAARTESPEPAADENDSKNGDDEKKSNHSSSTSENGEL